MQRPITETLTAHDHGTFIDEASNAVNMQETAVDLDDGRPHITEDAKPTSLSSHEKDAIKQALLDAAKQGHLNGSTANMLIKQFQQVDAA